MSFQPRNVTALHIVDDLEAAGVAFAALGFVGCEDDAGAESRSWRASNGSSLMMTSRARFAREFGAQTAARLGHGVVPMVWVLCLTSALEELNERAAGGCEVLVQAVTARNTVEAIVRIGNSHLLLAQRLGA